MTAPDDGTTASGRDLATAWPETPLQAVLETEAEHSVALPPGAHDVAGTSWRVAGRPLDELEERLIGAVPRRGGGRRHAHLVVAAITIVGLVLVWYALPNLGLVNPLLLPDPIEVAKGFGALVSGGFLLHHFKVTMVEVGIGFGLGSAIGFTLGTLLAVLPVLRQIFSPYILALQSLPKVVLAPLIIGWLGFGIESKIATAVAICFFPLMINTMVGLTLPAPDPLKLMRSLGASRWQIYRKLRLPTAAPLIFVGIKHAALLAFTGALVAEILIGSSEGLGRLVAIYNQQIRMELAFAVVAIVAVIAVAVVMIFDYLDRKLIFWREDKGAVQ